MCVLLFLSADKSGELSASIRQANAAGGGADITKPGSIPTSSSSPAIMSPAQNPGGASPDVGGGAGGSTPSDSQGSGAGVGAGTDAGPIRATPPMWRCSRIMHMQVRLVFCSYIS